MSMVASAMMRRVMWSKRTKSQFSSLTVLFGLTQRPDRGEVHSRRWPFKSLAGKSGYAAVSRSERNCPAMRPGSTVLHLTPIAK